MAMCQKCNNDGVVNCLKCNGTGYKQHVSDGIIDDIAQMAHDVTFGPDECDNCDGDGKVDCGCCDGTGECDNCD